MSKEQGTRRRPASTTTTLAENVSSASYGEWAPILYVSADSGCVLEEDCTGDSRAESRVHCIGLKRFQLLLLNDEEKNVVLAQSSSTELKSQRYRSLMKPSCSSSAT
jgi:hypothetical protein